MAEEKKKKESFTFSDKIKNSKPAPSKSFANRVSSKVGSDGKPRQTLFERTKRDAPFFIAALVALLLLPFLYKYSGNVEEDPTPIVVEGPEINPGNQPGVTTGTWSPDGQIAQLSGRDPMTLILPYGSKQVEEDKDDGDEIPPERYGYTGKDKSVATHKSDVQDEEDNTTNIYRYRRNGPHVVRGPRVPTKINRLGGANRAGASGNKLGVGMWGGGLKSAANKVRSQAPQSAPKPVSLQPLQSAGKPSRSYFGQGAAAEARRSKDAMSKANAMQALMDAQMRPVDTGKIGGIMGGADGAPGGGNGNLKREFLYNGKEPWWWDMMKQQEMMKWQKLFEFKWSLINWATDLLKNILGGVLNCLLTGTDDGSMGKLWATREGGGAADECNGMTAEDWAKNSKTKEIGEMNKFNCRYAFGWVDGSDDPDPWKGGNQAKANMGWWNSRVDCMVNGAGAARAAAKAGRGVVSEETGCANFYQTGTYTATVGGNYTIFSYVVGVAFDDLSKFYAANSATEREKYLKIAYLRKSPTLIINSSDVTQELNQKKFMPLFVESVAIKSKKVVNPKYSVNKKRDQYSEEAGDISGVSKPEKTENSEEALIAKVEKSQGTGYNAFKASLAEHGVAYNYSDVEGNNQQISTKSAKVGKSWSTGARCAYPMAFIGCHNNGLYNNGTIEDGVLANGVPAAFLNAPNLTNGKASDETLQKIKQYFTVTYEIQGEDQNRATGLSTSTDSKTGRLYYANIHNSSDNYGDSNVRSDKGMHLTSGKGTYVVKVGEAKALKEIESLLGSSSGQGAAPKGDPTDGDDDGWDQRGSAAATTTDSDSGSKENRVIITWTVRQTYNENTPWALAEPLANGKGGSVTVSGKSADGKKTTGSGARVGGQIVSQATCEYYNEDTFSPGISITECKSKDESRYCCEQEAKKSENLGKEFVWDEDTKQCKEKTTTTPPPTGPQPPPTGPQPQPTVKKTRLARYFEWVPSEATCHKALEEGKAPTKNETYCNGGKIAVQQDKQHCMYPSGELVLNSDAAAKFVNDVVKKYNETYKDKPAIVYGEKEHPSAGEFADALNIAPTVGITDVPKSAVCELGRRMVQESEDPHLKGDWHNELGAFFAYIHKEAVFYPAKFYKAKGNCDERFMGQGIDEGVCKNGTVPQAFHHNNYTYNGKTGMNGYESSAQELGLPAGRNGKYPLAALGEGLVNGLYDTCYNQTANKTACGTQVNDYRRAVGPLIDSNQDQGGVGVGNACNTLSGTMKVKDALDYVIQVCKNGLNAKPSSVSGNGNGQSLQNTGNTADTGKNPNDNSSRKGNNGLR